MKKIAWKIKNTAGKTFRRLREKTAGPADFLKQGRPGGMIFCALLAAQFLYGVMSYLCRNVMPAFLAFLLSVLLAVIVTELAALLLKILLGRVKRARVYYLLSAAVLIVVDLIGTQMNGVASGVLIGVVTAAAVDVLGRCLWSILVVKNHKQKFGYAALALSLGIVVLFGLFFHTDRLGENQIQKYLALSEDSREGSADFAAYLENGNGKTAVVDYGPDVEAGIVTERVDISGFAARDGLMAFPSKFYFKQGLQEAPVAGRIWYPEDGSACPVLFIAHGNHDFGVPSYLGYDYLGEYLASNGYVVVSVDENVVNSLSNENDARAVLLLENIRAVLTENEEQKSVLYGKIDSEKIAIAGHSRGGEMVATAYLFNDLDAYPDNGNIRFDYHFPISSIIAIAPTVDQYMPAQHAVELWDVNYLLLHGLHDQDVSRMAGEKQYHNVRFSKENDTLYRKASVCIMGANHGQFNTKWGRYDGVPGTNGFLHTAHFLEAEEQQMIAKGYIRAFLDTTLLGDCAHAGLLKGDGTAMEALPQTVYITNYTDSDFVSFCSFEDDADITQGDAAEITVRCRGMKTWKERADIYGSGMEGENHVLNCTWTADAEPRVEIDIPETDLSAGGIAFRLADMREDTAEEIEALHYTVELYDAAGNAVTAKDPQLVYPSLAVQLYKQDVLFGSYEYKHQMQTVSLGKDAFPGDAEFDFTSVCKICVAFDGSGAGEIIMDDVGFYHIFFHVK
ncbi:MAG: hypothetical protein NC302_09385 [Bacteroidales bacterium]|nr:hypothetical protein [Bacteroidales bacterium]MCM1416077.1 hypothetical protein [bacterium]MCM1422786.1 hypothetical protein [bacterium]